MDFTNLIKPELFALVPFLYGVGFIFGKIPKIKIWIVDILVAIVSILATIAYLFVYNIEGNIGKTLLVGVMQGVFIALAAITSVKAIRHIVKNNDGEKKAALGDLVKTKKNISHGIANKRAVIKPNIEDSPIELSCECVATEPKSEDVAPTKTNCENTLPTEPKSEDSTIELSCECVAVEPKSEDSTIDLSCECVATEAKSEGDDITYPIRVEARK